jgi:hypothetical protein
MKITLSDSAPPFQVLLKERTISLWKTRGEEVVFLQREMGSGLDYRIFIHNLPAALPGKIAALTG